MLMLQSLEGSVWPAPTLLVEKSPLLAELVMAGTQHQPLTVKLMESQAAYALLVSTCTQSWMFLPPDGTPLDVIAGARRLAILLGVPEPLALTRAASLIVMEILRASGYSLDPRMCAMMSADLEMTFPRTVSRVLATHPFREVLEMAPDISPRTVQLLGETQYAAALWPMVETLRRRPQGLGGR